MDTSEYLAKIGCIPNVDMEYAIENLGGSESLYERLLRKVVSMLCANISDMDRQLDAAGDLSAFGVKAHGIKSSLNQIGCLSLGELAEKLEKAAKQGDRDYCNENYGRFKEEIHRLFEQADAIARETAEEAESESISEGNLRDYYNTLKQVMDAAEGFESLPGARRLAPLTRLHFGGKADLLILKALAELEAFRPRKAAAYLAELLDACERAE